MRVNENDGCGRVSPAPVFVCEEGTREVENKSIGLHFLLAFQDKRELNDLGGEWFPQPSSGCGDASGSVIQKRWSKIERKGVKRMVGEVDGGVRKKV